ncbi:magnesium transporter [Paenibacillus sp. MY03]|uniref:magnesium transporter n=1 Tax=Paenibacillus sp. MY03 TaxID=302980 RepID=UPI000B3D0F8D|nr:magnesium transporter [Paenibacillus sp. MY03]OUS73668.1 magnesium transporter [Paenibacillus sp. MY03]
MVMHMNVTEIDMHILRALEAGDKVQLLALAEELQPYDLAGVYDRLPGKQRAGFVIYLTMELLTAMVGEMEREPQIEVFELLGVERTAQLMDRMDKDDLAGLLGGLSEERKQSFLDYMKEEESQAVRHLMTYAPETAGRIMTNRYVWIPLHFTVRNAVEKLKEFAEIAESISYLYVVDGEKKLLGVVSYRDLILADAEERIADIMYERVISVPSDMDQEDVARMIERYDFIAVPVVEDGGILVGIVTVDDIIDVVIREASEDIAKLSASGKSIDFDTKAIVAAWRRLPWLILLLLIGVISGTIISRFEETLDKVVALAFFMPMIAGMTGNTGTQSLAVVVRGLTTREATSGVIKRLIWRELLVGLLIGGICGTLISVIAYVWQGSPVLGLVVGSSLVVTLVIGTLAGTVIPILLYRLKVDPAVASGPLITTLNDILSLLIYFGIATAFLEYLI